MNTKFQIRSRTLLPPAFTFCILALVIAGMGCQGMQNSTGTNTTKTLTSISISPATANISMGATQQFTATAKYNDGSTANVSSTVTWSVNSSSIATINATGLATGKASGSVNVTASLSGMSGSATLQVQASTKTVTAISVAPKTASVNVGAQQSFTATATYSDGSSGAISSVTWSSSAPSIATVTAGGIATGVSAGSTTITAASGAVTGTATLTVNSNVVTALSVTPASVNLSVGGTVQLAATATYQNGPPGNVSSSATWSSTNSSVATVDSSGLVIAVGQGDATVSASFEGFNGSSSIEVSAATNTGVNIPMFHVDQNRSGLNDQETILTPANVTPSSFGKLFSYLVDGYVYGQPLLISNLTMSDGNKHNVLFAATENDSVYAFDADSNTGANAGLLWKMSLLQSGETPLTSGPIQPFVGVSSTPAIDTTTNTIYVVSTQTSSAAGATFRLSALDLTTGLQKYGGPVAITAKYPGTNSDSINGYVYLTTACLQRAALLVAYRSVYIGFGGCHSGWLLAYSETTLAQTGVFNMSPNLDGEGAYGGAGGVWMGGGGPAADGNGNVYVSTGNGPYSATAGSYGDSIVKFSSTLGLEDYFTPYVYAYMDCNDADLASGGLLLIPASGSTPMQALAGGKTGKMYLVSTENLGQEQNDDAGATYTTFFEPDLSPPYTQNCTSTGIESGSAEINSYEIFGTSAYFNGSVYLGITPTGAVDAPIRQFAYSPGTSDPLAYSPTNYTRVDYIQQGSYGSTPFISANGTSDGVLWMIDHGDPLQNSESAAPTSAVLRAFDPDNLASGELYDSSMNSGDAAGYGIKFTAPMAANGKVYIPTAHNLTSVPNPQGEIDVYGLK